MPTSPAQICYREHSDSSANLRGAVFPWRNLRHVSLFQADMCNANLLGAELQAQT